jgi:hypothetical protein
MLAGDIVFRNEISLNPERVRTLSPGFFSRIRSEWSFVMIL